MTEAYTIDSPTEEQSRIYDYVRILIGLGTEDSQAWVTALELMDDDDYKRAAQEGEE